MPTTNIALSLHPQAPPGQHRNDLLDHILEDEVQDSQLFSIDYAIGGEVGRHPLDEQPVASIESLDTPPGSKPLWQILHEEDEDEDEDDISTGSFSSVSSSLSSFRGFASVAGFTPGSSSSSSNCGIAMPRPLTKRKSMSVMRSGSRMIYTASTDICSVDDCSHPLSTSSESASEDEEEDKHPVSSRSLSFVSALSARFKALKSAAMEFSQSHQSLLVSTTGSDVFTFSPRSTDECAPSGFREPARQMAMPIVARGGGRNMTVPVRMRSRIAAQSAIATAPAPATAKPEPPKDIVLDTYSVQHHILPPPPRVRDIRENPDFLRVYALESLMRRNGKLDPGFEGKACVALVPRADKIPDRSLLTGDLSRFPKYRRACEADARLAKREVPRRWIGICAYA